MSFSAAELFERCSPSIANLIAEVGGWRVSSGTGFMVKGKLVTCAHVTELPEGAALAVVFERPNNDAAPRWVYQKPLQFLGYSEEQSYDFAILDVDPSIPVGPSLVLSDRLPEPGEPVCMIGYPFEDPHLTIHQGIISAVFKSGVATMLKLDMSVNPSNSGGPLVSMIDESVLGVVARKATGLTSAFDQLIAGFGQNAAVLKSVQGGVSLSGIDPIEVLAIIQEQMKTVSLEIRRSANVGIGYAVWIDPLCNDEALKS